MTIITAVEATVAGKLVRYQVGTVYKGLLLSEIRDQSCETEINVTFQICGFAGVWGAERGGNDKVFELCNLPTHVEYGACNERP